MSDIYGKPSVDKSINDDGTTEFFIWFESGMDMVLLYEENLLNMLDMINKAKEKELQDNG